MLFVVFQLLPGDGKGLQTGTWYLDLSSHQLHAFSVFNVSDGMMDN
jgi:hypothetical protein